VIRFLLTVVFVCATAVSCSDTSEPLPNKLPTVHIVSAPQEGSVTGYTPTIHWDGFDPDGESPTFEYVITNNVDGSFDPAQIDASKWTATAKFSDTFLVSADMLTDSSSYDAAVLAPEEYSRAHTFLVNAVDAQGTRSVEPARRTFVSRTLSPEVDLLSPRAVAGQVVQVGSRPTFQWLGIDHVGTLSETLNPEFARWIIVGTGGHGSFAAALDYVRTTPDAPEWSGWLDYGALDLSGQSVRVDSLAAGDYVFAVQVRDEALAISGAIDEDRNAVRLTVGP